MALVKRTRKLNAIRYICRADSAVDMEASDRDLYESDPMKHADALVLKEGEEPTVFILNFELTGREDSLIKDARVKGYDNDSKDTIITLGSWALRVAKFCLKGIENPPGIDPLVVYKKDSKGYVADYVLDVLSPTGVIEEIWQLFVVLRESRTEEKENLKN